MHYQAVPSVKKTSFCYADCMTPVQRKQMDGDEQQFGPQQSTSWSNPHPVLGAVQEFGAQSKSKPLLSSSTMLQCSTLLFFSSFGGVGGKGDKQTNNNKN